MKKLAESLTASAKKRLVKAPQQEGSDDHDNDELTASEDEEQTTPTTQEAQVALPLQKGKQVQAFSTYEPTLVHMTHCKDISEASDFNAFYEAQRQMVYGTTFLAKEKLFQH